jgi:hypothetical protein
MKKAILLFLLATLMLGAMEPVAPAEGPTGIQFVVRLIEASSDPGAPNDAADVVPASLKSVLRHESYSQTGVVILRGRETEFSLGSLIGEIDAKIIDRGGEKVIEFDLEVVQIRKVVEDGEEYSDDTTVIEYSDETTVIESSDIAKDGETVVLGASSIKGGGKAMIVLMTPTIIR